MHTVRVCLFWKLSGLFFFFPVLFCCWLHFHCISLTCSLLMRPALRKREWSESFHGHNTKKGQDHQSSKVHKPLVGQLHNGQLSEMPLAWAGVCEKPSEFYQNMRLASSPKTFVWLANILRARFEKRGFLCIWPVCRKSLKACDAAEKGRFYLQFLLIECANSTLCTDANSYCKHAANTEVLKGWGK